MEEEKVQIELEIVERLNQQMDNAQRKAQALANQKPIKMPMETGGKPFVSSTSGFGESLKAFADRMNKGTSKSSTPGYDIGSKFNVPDSGKTPTNWSDVAWKQKTVNSLDKNSSMLNAANKWYKPVVDKLGDNTKALKKTEEGGGSIVSSLLSAKGIAGGALAAYGFHKTLQYGMEGAAMRNPQASATNEGSWELLKMEIGRGFDKMQNFSSNAAQGITKTSQGLKESTGTGLGDVLAYGVGRALPDVLFEKQSPFYNVVRKNIPGGAMLGDWWNKKPPLEAPPPQQSQSFGNMAEWQNSMVQENLSLGGPNSTERAKWNIQAQAMQEDQNKPQVDPGGIPRDDAGLKLLQAVLDLKNALGGDQAAQRAFYMDVIAGGLKLAFPGS